MWVWIRIHRDLEGVWLKGTSALVHQLPMYWSCGSKLKKLALVLIWCGRQVLALGRRVQRRPPFWYHPVRARRSLYTKCNRNARVLPTFVSCFTMSTIAVESSPSHTTGTCRIMKFSGKLILFFKWRSLSQPSLGKGWCSKTCCFNVFIGLPFSNCLLVLAIFATLPGVKKVRRIPPFCLLKYMTSPDNVCLINSPEICVASGN